MMTEKGERQKTKRSPHPYATLLLVMLGISAFISICTGRPSDMPSIALGSSFLLYVERTVALFAGCLLLVVILVEAWRGNLPVEISGRGVKYERLKEETKEGFKALVEAILKEREARGETIKKP